MMGLSLPFIFLVLMSIAILIYVVLDGFDLGVGILTAFADDTERNSMIASIGPFWDANETWLVLGIGLLLVAFPHAHGVILTALYLPVTLMLTGLILRGVAFDFRHKAISAHRAHWNRAFWFGSLLASLAQGWMLGSYILGFRQDAVGILFAGLIALCLSAGYALLGATWLLMKSSQSLWQRARVWAYRSLWLTGFGIAAVSLATPWANQTIFAKWFSIPNIFFLGPIPIASAIAFFYAETILRQLKKIPSQNNGRPFVYVVILFLLAFIGLAYSLFPFLVAQQITYVQAAAADASLEIILYGTLVSLPIIIAYSFYVYRVFWGRATTLSYE